MAIDWTPWFNVPLHRRLELFSVAALNSCGLLLPTVILFSVFYIIVSREIRIFQSFSSNDSQTSKRTSLCMTLFCSFTAAFFGKLFVRCIWHLFTMTGTQPTEVDAALGKNC